jgi:chemotaxis protein CheC
VAQPFTDIQLDAMRELGNIGSGTAATALSNMIGMPVDIDVARASMVPITQIVEAAGPPDTQVTAVMLPITGDMDAQVIILMQGRTVETVCELLGVPANDEISDSALCEVGNILGASYAGALGQMVGASLEPHPPELVRDALTSILAPALLATGEDEMALMLESTLTVDDRECSPSFLFMPSASGLTRIFKQLGLGQ